jgi:phage/plasmid primase-like uncharacterized protein
VTNDEAILQFVAAMQSRHLALADRKQLIADGQWHRCTATNKSSPNTDGTYRLCLNGPAPWGLYRNWTDGKDADHWRGDLGRALTDAERAGLDRRIDQQRREHEKEAADLAAEACNRALDIWDSAEDAPAAHPYLKRKRVKPHGLRVSEHGRLLIPMYDPDCKLVNLQFIDDEGAKWFLRGGRAKGCYFQIDGKLGPIVVAEGFATAASINEVTGYYVVIGFNASNLTPVATMARQAMNNFDANIWRAHKKVAKDSGYEHDRRPTFFDAQLVVAADDDWKSTGNPGLIAALRAARAARALVARPRFNEKDREDGDTDFNDLAVLYGDKAVAEDIEEAVEPKRMLEILLEKDPHSAFDRGVVDLLAMFRQDDQAWYERILADLKKNKLRIRELDREVKAAVSAAANVMTKSAYKTPVPVDIDELATSAEEIIACKDVLELFGETCGQVVAGEETLTKLLYLSGTSRLLDKAMHVAIKGPSAAGKSEIRRRVLQFFPAETVISFTAQSEKALLYFKDDFAHKILSMGEAMNPEEARFQDYLLRELLSEAKLNYPVVQKQPDGSLETVTITKNGPVAFMVTTTRNQLHPENETRMLSVEANDTPEQTKKVVAMVAQVEGLNKGMVSADLKPWQDYQRWLAAGECRVFVPFADALAELIPPKAVRLRRDFGQLLRAIKVHALLHRDHRRSTKGSIVATIDEDYSAVRALMADILATAAEVKTRKAVQETVEVVDELQSEDDSREGVSARAVATLLKLDISTTRRRLYAAESAGFVINLEDRPRRPGRYVMVDEVQQGHAELLPTCEKLWEHYDRAGQAAAVR